MAVRKGFIRTLEAVISSTIIIGMLIFVMPEVADTSTVNTEIVRKGIQKIDHRDNLSSDTDIIEKKLEKYVQDDFNITVRQVNADTALNSSISGGKSFYLSENSYIDLLLWVNSSSGFNASFNEEKVISEFSGEGYIERSVEGSGWLNFTGNVDADIIGLRYPSDGKVPRSEEVYTINYLTWKKGLKEVQIRLWQK